MFQKHLCFKNINVFDQNKNPSQNEQISGEKLVRKLSKCNKCTNTKPQLQQPIQILQLYTALLACWSPDRNSSTVLPFSCLMYSQVYRYIRTVWDGERFLPFQDLSRSQTESYE